MKLLALDQSSRISGWAVFDNNKLIAHGKIVTTHPDIGDRLNCIRKEVISLIDKYNIEEVVFEDIQLQSGIANNVATFKILAEVFGVLEELFTEIHMPHQAVLSTVWKSGLSIKGRERATQKKNAQKFITDTYNLRMSEDESDAACIGTYYIQDREKEFNWS